MDAMSNCYKYDIYEVPIGWIGVISTQVGLTNCFIDSNQTTLHNRMNAFITIDETLKLNSRMLQTSITQVLLFSKSFGRHAELSLLQKPEATDG